MKAEQSTALAVPDNKASKDKSTITHIKDIRMKDIIVVDKEEDGIFKGWRYYGDKENHVKTTSGHVNSYFEISDKGQRYLANSCLRFLDHIQAKNVDYY